MKGGHLVAQRPRHCREGQKAPEHEQEINRGESPAMDFSVQATLLELSFA
jgi:hypothetical protein